MRQLAAGLQVLRENNVVHRDLKPQNLLLSTSDGNSVLKIADFGFARSLQPRGLAETLCGSPLYMAPEVMQYQKYDAKADLWSVGVILFQLITGKTPFDGNSHPQLLQNIGKANVLHLLSDSNLSHDCIDLCQKLLRRIPDSSAMDSLEFVDHDYVLVPGPPLEMSSSSASASRSCNSPCKSESSPIASPEFSALSAPMPIIGAAINKTSAVGSLESHSSPASETSQGSMDMGDAMEQPSAHCLTRIRSLQRYASVITELVKDKIENGRRLEAFAVQLVVLAIWKQALHICHAHAASAMEGSPCPETRTRESSRHASNTGEYISCIGSKLPVAVCSLIEKEFLLEVGHAEELAVDFGQIAETTEMPDAIEIIFQSALTLGRHGAVDEMMGSTGKASSQYSKAVCLLYFLLVEAPSLTLSPPFSPTNSDRYRLRSYIDVLNNRQGRSLSQRIAL